MFTFFIILYLIAAFYIISFCLHFEYKIYKKGNDFTIHRLLWSLLSIFLALIPVLNLFLGIYILSNYHKDVVLIKNKSSNK